MVDTEEKGNMLFLISFSYLTGRLSSRQWQLLPHLPFYRKWCFSSHGFR
jgi:hypothetical protein